MAGKMLLKLCFVLVLFSQVLAKNELYEGYKVYNIKFETEEQESNFKLIKRDQLDFWKHPSWERNVVGRVMVPATDVDWFEEKLRDLYIDIDVQIENVLEYLNEKDTTRNVDGASRAFDFNDYYRYNEILSHLEDLQTSYASSTTTSLDIVEYGRTDEDRRLVYLKIGRIGSAATKPVIIVEAGINPREWITVPAAINVVNNILDEAQTRFLDNFDWIIIPVLNPDGYEFTHSSLRYWEKSRSTKTNWGAICPGVNINRNFDIDWGTSGSSSSPCSNIYAGVSAFSETESQMVASIIDDYGERIRLYISLQNNGGSITYPWYYERAATALFKRNHLLGLEMVSAVSSNYDVGVSSVVVDRVSGTASDYARINGIVNTYNIDIEQSEDGNYVIPATNITRIVNDVWAAIAVAADNVLN